MLQFEIDRPKYDVWSLAEYLYTGVESEHAASSPVDTKPHNDYNWWVSHIFISYNWCVSHMLEDWYRGSASSPVKPHHDYNWCLSHISSLAPRLDAFPHLAGAYRVCIHTTPCTHRT